MTTFDRFDPFERRITDAVHEIADERRPAYLDDILQLTARSSQRTRWASSERWTSLNRTLIGAAVALVVIVAAGSYLLTRSNGPVPGGHASPTPITTASPSATNSPTTIPFGAMASTVWGDWHADNVAIPGITGPQLVRLSLNWDGGLNGWIQLDGDGSFRQVLQFHSLTATAGELRFRADTTAECNAGDEGRYSWTRSADGLFLTLQLIQDGCQTRATAFARTWVHSLSAVTDGGLGVLPDNPWTQITMPKQRFGASGFGTDASWLHPMSDTDPKRFYMVIVDPMGFDAPCKTTRKPASIVRTTTAFEQYLVGLPGVTVKGADTTIDGVSGRLIDVVIDKPLQCATGDLGMFHSRVASETDADWTMAAGEAIYLWATVDNGDLRVYGYGGDGVTAPDGHMVIQSIKFLNSLPTP